MSFPDKFYLYNKGTLIYECEWWELPRIIEAMEKEYQSYIDNGAIEVLEKALEEMKAKQKSENLERGASELRGILRGLTEIIRDGDTANLETNKELLKTLKKWDQEGTPEQRNEETK